MERVPLRERARSLSERQDQADVPQIMLIPVRKRILVLIVLLLAGSCLPGPPALAQREVLDNIILLGGIEAIKTPGVESTTDRPEEKAPRDTYRRKLESLEFHRPKSGRSHPESAGYLTTGHPLLASEGDSMKAFLEGNASVFEARQKHETNRLPQPRTPRPEGGLPGHEEVSPGLNELLIVNRAGRPGGLTLEAAIERVVHHNRELQALAQEIPQAEADVLTASLRENPLIFWDAGGIPYGSFHNSPGTRAFPIVLVFPIDLTGRRKARIRVAREAKGVIRSRYVNEVRLRIEEVQNLHLDLLSASAEIQARQAGLRGLDALLRAADQGRVPLDASTRRSLRIERNLTRLTIDETENKMRIYRRDLAGLLDLPRESARSLSVFGRLRDVETLPPPREALCRIALACRPDLSAQRRSLSRSLAMHDLEKARQYRDTYLLYEPWAARVGTDYQGRQKTSNEYAVGLFVPLPLFDRNQGNLQRSSIEVSKMQTELGALGRDVLDEVGNADDEYHGTLRSVQQLEREVLPEVVRDRLDTWRRFQKGEASADEFLSANRIYQSVARHYRDAVTRHRRTMLHLNTVVANRVVP